MRYGIILLALLMMTAWCEAQRARECRPDRRAAAAAKTDLQKILETALDDERWAKAYYTAVIKEFGERRPFTNIVQAEARHEQRLLNLFDRYGFTPPKDRYAAGDMDVPPTLAEATAKAIEHEKKNAAMYGKFLEQVTEADVRETMEYLKMASEEHHLPALERQRGGGGAGGGAGQGQGQGRGWRGGRGQQAE